MKYEVEIGITNNNSSEESLFYQDWWLRIAKGKLAQPDSMAKFGGATVSALSYGVRKRFGLRSVGNCDWTPLCGPRFFANLRPDDVTSLVRQLIKQLPPASFSRFTLPADQLYIDPIKTAFINQGYRYSLKANYTRAPQLLLLNKNDSEELILRSLNKRVRKHLMSAARRLEIISCPPAAFLKFFAKNLQEGKAEKSRHSLDVALQLLEIGVARDQAEVMVAQQANGSWDAAIACVWDKDRYYLWMATRRLGLEVGQSKPNADATKLLAIKAMARAQQLHLIFDADSLGTPGAQQLYDKILKIGDGIEYRHVFIRHTIKSKIGLRLYNAMKSLSFSGRVLKRKSTLVSPPGKDDVA